MTEGGIGRHIISFALPLLMGNIFQQLYNTVDTWVVGNFVSNEAFSAVGTVGPVVNMLIGFFLGLSTGAEVVISQYYGAKLLNKVEDTVHTALAMTLVLSAIFTMAGLAMIPAMLKFMNTPPEVLPESTAYLTIYFSGMAGLMFYNMGSGILRAVGDSRHPFYYLVASATINIILDLTLVILFHLGVRGVAYATIISQGVSALMVILNLLHRKGCVRFRVKKLRLHADMLKKIIAVGFPAAVQMALTSFSNVFVQSYINYFGADCMSGWTAYSKLDQLVFLPVKSIALASTTFVGQNLGIGYVERAKKGVRTAAAISLCTTILIIIPIVVFAPNLTAFFNKKPEVVAYGTMMLRHISPFYVLSCINQTYSGALRGAGKSRGPMFIMLFSFVVFRQCYLYLLTRFVCNRVLPVIMGYPAGWLVCSVLTLIYYHASDISRGRLTDSETAG